jgi:hypothetical protein
MKKQLIEIFITYRNDYMGKNTTTVKLTFGKYFFMTRSGSGDQIFLIGECAGKEKLAPYFLCLLFFALFFGTAEFMGM